MTGQVALREVLAKAERDLAAEAAVQISPKSVRDIYRWLAPQYEVPEHLAPYLDALDRAVIHGNVQLAIHAHPQSGKTQAAIFALIFACLRQKIAPQKIPPSHAYSSYNDDRARDVKKDFVRWAQLAGLNPRSSSLTVRLDGGSRIKFSRNITGWPVRRGSLHIVDDPVKDLEQVVSGKMAAELRGDFQNVYLGRAHPGASLIVIMHRWAVDDIIGWLVRDFGWRYIRLSAICDAADDPIGRKEGQILWSSPALGRTQAWYEEKKKAVGARTWASLWQGDPRPEGGSLFGPASYYEDHVFPEGPYSMLYGLDLAYTDKTRSDYSVLIQGRYYHWSRNLYLTRIERTQEQADAFNARIRAVFFAAPGPMTFIGGGGEEGIAHVLRSGGLSTLQFVGAHGDKYSRAFPVAERLWNAPNQRIFVPRLAAWTPDFVREIEGFSGAGGAHDDQLDALVALCHILIRGMMGSSADANWSQTQRDLSRRFSARLRTGSGTVS